MSMWVCVSVFNQSILLDVRLTKKTYIYIYAHSWQKLDLSYALIELTCFQDLKTYKKKLRQQSDVHKTHFILTLTRFIDYRNMIYSLNSYIQYIQVKKLVFNALHAVNSWGSQAVKQATATKILRNSIHLINIQYILHKWK